MLTPEQCSEIKARLDEGMDDDGCSLHYPTDVAALLATVEALRAELADVLAERDAMQALATQSGRELHEAVELLQRAVKYATEDRAVTPGSTRLARLLDKASAFLARHGGV